MAGLLRLACRYSTALGAKQAEWRRRPRGAGGSLIRGSVTPTALGIGSGALTTGVEVAQAVRVIQNGRPSLEMATRSRPGTTRREYPRQQAPKKSPLIAFVVAILQLLSHSRA